MRSFCGIDHETLASLLNDEDFGDNVILDIQSLCIDTSPAKKPIPSKETTLFKQTSSGVRTFIGIRLKISTSIAFKQPKVVKETTYKPSISDPISYVMITIVLYLVSLNYHHYAKTVLSIMVKNVISKRKKVNHDPL